jgi:SAM-dependent methyltransferase
MLETLKALADATRLRLVAVLSCGEFTVRELTAVLAMGQSRISRHLKILVEAQILSVKRQGTWGYYRLEKENPFFRSIWPSLAQELEAAPGRQEDLEAVAGILDSRRRRSREFFEQHARQWDALAEELLPVPEYRKILLREVPSCELLLEVGVGTGRLLGALQEKVSRVVGVDHSAAMLELARGRVREEGLSEVDLRLGEMTHLPLTDGEAACVLLNMVLHHAAQPEVVLVEIGRVLAPDGTLLVADLQRHEQEWVREKMADQWLGFDQGEMASWLSAAGFSLERFLEIPGTAGERGVFVLVARKGTRTAS